jgi:hypothetical protein
LGAAAVAAQQAYPFSSSARRAGSPASFTVSNRHGRGTRAAVPLTKARFTSFSDRGGIAADRGHVIHQE